MQSLPNKQSWHGIQQFLSVALCWTVLNLDFWKREPLPLPVSMTYTGTKASQYHVCFGDEKVSWTDSKFQQKTARDSIRRKAEAWHLCLAICSVGYLAPILRCENLAMHGIVTVSCEVSKNQRIVRASRSSKMDAELETQKEKLPGPGTWILFKWIMVRKYDLIVESHSCFLVIAILETCGYYQGESYVSYKRIGHQIGDLRL